MRIRTLFAATLIAAALLAVLGCGESDRPGLAWGTPAAVAEDGRGGSAEATRAGFPRAGDIGARRLWSGDAVFAGLIAVSPDGRYVTRVDPSSGALLVLDLPSGETHRVATRPQHSRYGQAIGTAFSRDGRRLAFVWSAGDENDRRVTDVRVVEFDGAVPGAPRASEPRVISANPRPRRVWDWSPDGEWVLGLTYGPDNTTALTLFSTAGDPERTLKTFDWREPLRAAFSPDGRYVAYDLPAASDRRQRDIHVVSLDGSRERVIVGGGAENRLFGWDPDGGILYVSEHGGVPSLWRLPVTDGQPGDAAERLRQDFWRARPIGIAGRSFYYTVEVERPSVHLAGVDLDAGRLTTAPLSIEDALGSRATGYAWSPDGNHLAIIYADDGRRGLRLALHATDGNTVGEIALRLVSGGRLRWTRDGASVMVNGADARGRYGFHRVSLETGEEDLVLRITDENWSWGYFDLSPDEVTLYYAHYGLAPGPRPELTLVARTLLSGEERPLGVLSCCGTVELSPDGTRIATVAGPFDPVERVVSVFPTAGGGHRELMRLRAPWNVDLQWMPDGQHIVLFAPRSDPAAESAVWLLPVDGGEARRLDGIATDIRLPALHPSGRRLAFRAGELRNEIWALELGAGAAAAAARGRSP